MNPLRTKLFAVTLMLVLATAITGCSGKKTCSADTQCKDGAYCNDGKCAEFKDDDYKIVFESPSDKATITSAQDLDLSVEGIQVNVSIAMEDAKSYIKDGMAVALVVKSGKNVVTFSGKFVKNKASFLQVTLPEGEVTLSAYLEQNSAIKTTITVNSAKMDMTMYYLKGGAKGTKTLLESSVITDEDDSDGNLENGIQLDLVAETSGMTTGDAVSLFFPQISQDDKAGEGNIDDKGAVVFENITVPVLANVTMTVVSGEYSKNVEFEVSSKVFCGFLLNIKDDQIFGKKDDKNNTLSGLQFDLVISEITGCEKGSQLSIYIDSDEAQEPLVSFTISSDQVEERITLAKSTSSEDKRSVLVVIEDETKNMKGKKMAERIIVDLDDPLVDISFPEVGAELNMTHDIDAETPGLQVNFEGDASDDITGPVSVEIKLGETVVSTLEDISGIFKSLHTFPQSIATAVLTVTVFDKAGNSSDTTVPFSVNIDTGIEFYSVCGKTGAEIIDAMWLNLGDDADEDTDLLQCKVIMKVGEGTGATHISLKAGDGEEVKKEIETGNTAEFDISLADSTAGITLNAKSYIKESMASENNLTVKVDTIPPVVTVANSLLLGNGGTTVSENINFEYHCTAELSCTFNALLDDETSTAFLTDAERVLTGLSNGAHSFKVKARDAAGNEGTQTVFGWTVDSEKPETTITSDPGAGTENDFALFTFTTTKPGAGSTFWCKLEKDGSAFIPDDGTFEECVSGKRDYYGLTDGEYRFLVKAEDYIGNVDPSPAEHLWTMGSVVPVTTIDTAVPAVSATNSTEMVFTYSATVDSTFECQLEKDGVEVEAWSDCSSGSVTYTALTDGSYLFLVRATAVYGTKELCPATYTWVVDTNLPKIRILSKPGKLTPYDAGTFLFECVGEADTCAFTCEFDSSTVDCAIGHYSFAGILEGPHKFSVLATDKAGNVSTVVIDDMDPYQNDYSWIVNFSALGVSITSKPATVTTSEDAEFSFESNKAASFECKIDEEAYATCTSPANYTGLSQGSHTFMVKATFAEEIAFASYTWTVDSAAPVVLINSGPANPTNKTGAVIYFSANEPATFECKLAADSEWAPCTNPKIYPSGTFGTPGTTKSYTFEVRAKDGAGNTGTSSYSWAVDLEVPTITWISPVPNVDGKITVGTANNVFGNDPVNYALKITVRVSGSNIGRPINVTGFKTPPGYTIVNVTSISAKNYELTVGLKNGARVNNPLKISVADDTGSSASVSKVVIVNTEMPTITWASPENNYKFISTTTAPSFLFNVWNALPGETVELIDFDTSAVVGTAVTVGASGTQEYVTITPVLVDRCAPYKLYATFFDTGESIRYYTNSTSDLSLRTSRNFTVDRVVAAIGDVTISGISDVDRILNRADNLNPNPEGGMQTDITVDISDAGNGADANRTVRILTNNGAGEPSSLLATLNGQGNTAEFKNVSLSENIHTLKIQVTDCSGNVTSKLLPVFTVDTIIPELAVSAPRGSSSNWRWLTAADAPALGTIDGAGKFTGIEMIVDSTEDISSFVEVIHTSYDYDGTQNYQNDISASAVNGTNSLTIALPDLEYAKHRFKVTVEDAAGNIAIAGNGSSELYEVDVIVPQIAFNDIHDGDSFDTDMDPVTPGFQIIVKMDMTYVEPQSTYMLKAAPVLSQGGGIDSSRIEKEWTGSVSIAGIVNKSIQLGNGWWKLSAIIKDNHDNQSSTGEIDINAIVSDPSITLKKSYNYSVGAGPVIQGASVESSAWMIPSDIVCTGDDCDTEIEVWTDAPAGSTAYISLNGGAEVSKSTVSSSGQSYAKFYITLDNSVAYNTIEVRLVSTTLAENESTDYIKIDETLPQLTLINPVTCTGICGRKDLADDPLTTDVIELAELGYGYADDAVAGGVLNFKTTGAIQFRVDGAEGGTVVIDSVSGIANGTASISYDSVGGYYYADFTTMTAVDSNATGQTDYNLVFKVIESPSGAISRYLVKLHVDLLKPAGIDISEKVSTFKKEGRVEMSWTALAGNNSTYGDLPGAAQRYDVRYQDYNTGSCTIGTSFTSAKIPIETIAGPVPDPVVVGEMEYGFFVNRINNGLTGAGFKEADTHKNGNKYCFAVRAIDAVYASDGTVLAENFGTILPKDTGEMKMEWTSIRADNPKEHIAILRNLGDLDGDGMDDFVIADGYKSSNGTDDDYAGNIQIVFSKGEMTFERSGAPDESLGQGVSSSSDFNGDGFLDFAYTNVNGEVFVHYGSETGLNSVAGTTFTAKDDNYDVFRRMATGDYNGDGCNDIAISAPDAGGLGTARGEVYMYFGRGELCSSEDAIVGSTPDVTFEGGNDDDQLGRANIYSVGDIDGDGKTDFTFSTDTKIFIAYGGDPGGVVDYTLTGFQSLVGIRIGYGNFNGDSYSDLVVADNSKINIYYGGDLGITTVPSMIINDISPVNYTYPPSVTNFAKAVSPESVDINGDGLTDLITASDRGLLVYETHLGSLSTMPSIFDPFISSSSAFIKVLMLDYGMVYCDNATNKGSCHILNYGE